MQKKQDFKLLFFVAFTQLKDKKTQTIVATSGVAFGIAIFIFLLSCVKGINDYITELSLAQYPHVRLFTESQVSEQSVMDKVFPTQENKLFHAKPKVSLQYLKNGNVATREIANNPTVMAVSASIKAQVFFNVGTTKTTGELIGIDYANENKLMDIDDKVLAGNQQELDIRPNSLIMGKALAERLNLNIGDKFIISTAEGQKYTSTLSAIIKTGIPDKDKTLCYASLKTVQNILQVPPSYISDINIKLIDRKEAAAYAMQLTATYGYKSSDWLKDNPFLFEGESLNRIIFYGIAGSILLVAGFGIFNILNMMIYEKMKDISIIKAIGFMDKDVRSIFMIQALSIGFAGSILGLLTGLMLSWGMTFIPYESDLFVSLEHFPMRFNINYYIFGFFFGLLTTALAGYLPSRKAAQLDPISILRG